MLVEKNDEFSVEVFGRSRLEYRDKEGKLEIGGELLAGPAGWALYKNTIKGVDENRKAIVIDNIKHAFRLQGFEIDVV